ncbi:hypothetical protein JCM17380_05200 [Desulfosporosinus burensis]
MFLASEPFCKPYESVNLLPIRKDYRGHKYESKDYFYTRDYIKGLDPSGGRLFCVFGYTYKNGKNTCICGKNTHIFGKNTSIFGK